MFVTHPIRNVDDLSWVFVCPVFLSEVLVYVVFQLV